MILELISNALAAVSKFFGWANQRDAEENSPAMQAGAQSARSQRDEDATNRAIAQKDVDQVRKDLAD